MRGLRKKEGGLTTAEKIENQNVTVIARCIKALLGHRGRDIKSGRDRNRCGGVRVGGVIGGGNVDYFIFPRLHANSLTAPMGFTEKVRGHGSVLGQGKLGKGGLHRLDQTIFSFSI